MLVQDYIIKKYSEELLHFIHLECSRNEWDYLMSMDKVEDIEDYIEPYKETLIWMADLR